MDLDTRRRITALIRGQSPHYSAFSPDMPGCVATGDSLADVQDTFRFILQKHLSRQDKVMPDEIDFYLSLDAQDTSPDPQ